MSTRTATVPAGRETDQSRRRRFGFRLRDVKIRSKLGLILLIPFLVIVALAGVELVGNGQTAASVSKTLSLAQLSGSAADVMQQLQNERDGAVSLLASGSDQDSATFRQLTVATDKAVAEYQARRAKISDVPTEVSGALANVDSDLKDLTELRSEVNTRKNTTITAMSFRYRVLMADILSYRESLSHLVTDPRLGDRLRAAVAISQAKQAVGEEQAVILRALVLHQYEPSQAEDFTSAQTGYDGAVQTFNQAAPADLIASFGENIKGGDVATASQLETQISNTPPGSPLTIDAAAWNTAMNGRLAKLRTVEQLSDAEVKSAAADQRDSLVRRLIIESAAIVLALILAAVLTFVVAGVMARSLRRLRQGALTVAYEDLPDSVARLRSVDDLGDMSPEDVAGQVRDPVRVQGRDEIGQVSQAFNVVHREAVRIAAEQASLRASVSTMFVNLARRSQLLVDRLIGHLDRLEQGEEDPDRLSQLFQLDHLATRMRRNDENLLVLAGADSSRARREAAPLGDVLRAAQSEVEQYTRIEFGIVDRDVSISASAVNDVVHLVAELLDNATSFSSPESSVVVDARRVGDRVIIQVEDYGIGMNDELLAELNERLANPPLVDVAVSRMMGLVVVGRLASRLEIRVELRRGTERGTVADVIVPAEVLEGPAPAGRMQATGLPAQAPPLALESGPGFVRPEEPVRRGMGQAPYQPTGRHGLADAAHGHGSGNGFAPTGNGFAPTGNGFAPGGRPTGPASRSSGPSTPPAPPAGRPTGPAEPSSGGPAGLPRRAPGGESPASATGSPSMGGGSLFDNANRRTAPPSGADRGTGPGSGGLAGLSRRQPAPGDAPGGAPAGRPGGDGSTAESPRVTPRRAARGGPGGAGGGPVTGSGEGDAGGRSSIESAPLDSRAAASTGPGEIIPRNVDDTMELPIFREVESAWFRTSPSRPHSDPAPTGTAPADTRPATRRSSATAPSQARPEAPQPAPPSSRPQPSRRPAPPASRPPSGAPGAAEPAAASGGLPTRVPGTNEPGAARPAAAERGAPAEVAAQSAATSDREAWRTAADAGWRRATQAADVKPDETTSSGLPKRRPMAQLVPGAVEPGPRAGQQNGPRERSPERVRGLLSAYHRGVQRGRSGGTQGTGPLPGRNSARGAGREQEA